MSRKKAKASMTRGLLSILPPLFLATVTHGMFAWNLESALTLSNYREAERDGHIVVSSSFLSTLGQATDSTTAFSREASRRRWRLGGSQQEREAELRKQFDSHGESGFVTFGSDSQKLGLASLPRKSPLGSTVGLLGVIAWFLMMAFQGEGLELDFQRRRHPMWEWLLSHPIHPRAAFLAEMLAPMAANPLLAAAPMFWGMGLWRLYDPPKAIMGAIAIGTVTAVAASCLAKTIEILAMLRFSPRTRGAVLGILSWLGYALFILGFFAYSRREAVGSLVRLIDKLDGGYSLPVLPWLFGVTAGGETSILLAVATSSAIAGCLVAVSVWLSAWATNAGLVSQSGDSPTRPTRLAVGRGSLFAKRPLQRKELLWLLRDRGAIIQAILIPLTIAAAQSLQFRDVAALAVESWNRLSGAALICGTYLLLTLGPRSLTSEGQALWMTLTWPHGLESLLKAKARLWWQISSCVVFCVLALNVARFPADGWKILLVAVGWLIFGRSLADKSVTLVTAPSSSGQPEAPPRSRRYAVMLGTFSFAGGVISENWHLAALGVAYSTLTAAALWQNFRQRLPYLYDPWSEQLPPAPTLMHAMVAISAMLEGMAIISLLLHLYFGAEQYWFSQALAYGAAGVVTWLATWHFLRGQGVPSGAVWSWTTDAPVGNSRFLDRLATSLNGQSTLALLVLAAGVGTALGGVGLLYQSMSKQIPFIAQYVDSMTQPWIDRPDQKIWILALSVVFAPLAEEYLFRGLLYRALDREWGGWSAILGSSLYFGVYHPPFSWLPVVLVGIVVAVFFRSTRKLWPGIVVHATYNLLVSSNL